MFAETLLESAPHPGHRSAWTKLVSAMAQSAALAVLLAIPLFHVERLQSITLGSPKIQMTPVAQLRSANRMRSEGALTPELPAHEIVQPNHIPSQSAQLHERSQKAEPSAPAGLTCKPSCGSSGALTNILSSGALLVDLRPPRPAHPVPVSEMQLGSLIHKVVPTYPEIAKRAGIQGTVLLSALIGKDGRVESVVPVSGHPMLVRAAEEAVRQWQYRP